jgi:hypothetical protein
VRLIKLDDALVHRVEVAQDHVGDIPAAIYNME